MILRHFLIGSFCGHVLVVLVAAHRDSHHGESLEDVQLDVEVESAAESQVSTLNKQPTLQSALTVSSGILSATVEATTAMTVTAADLLDGGLSQVSNSSQYLTSTPNAAAAGDQPGSSSHHADVGHHRKNHPGDQQPSMAAAHKTPKLDHFVAVEVDAQASPSITHHYRPARQSEPQASVGPAPEASSSHDKVSDIAHHTESSQLASSSQLQTLAGGLQEQTVSLTKRKTDQSSNEAAHTEVVDLEEQNRQLKEHQQNQEQHHQQNTQQDHQQQSHQLKTQQLDHDHHLVHQHEHQQRDDKPSPKQHQRRSRNEVVLLQEAGLPLGPYPRCEVGSAEGTDLEGKYGCSSTCSCGWSEQCYPWQTHTNKGNQPENVGVCGDAVVIMIMYSCLLFSVLLFLVVTLRFALAPKPCY
mmetsp:Transcript_6595/g.14330  ORF Transcript_6595/g.14330 Transcript_6595/m.14330 type:complete len:413 (-) Transcript_6595:23-1261(-)